MKGTFNVFCETAIFAAVFVMLAGCNFATHADGRAATEKLSTKSAWLVYWDLDAGEKDLKPMGKFDKISFFGAYFNKYDRLFIPVELSDKKRDLKKQRGKFESYLTFVNDKQNWDGTLIPKDTEVLRRYFCDAAAIEKHIDEIIALALQGGYDGIEIDYEKIWKDEVVGRSFLSFVDMLHAKALKNRLKVRVVLEPSAPFTTRQFPKGPEYVVMYYNLFGLHGEPGPKANKAFIEKTATRMRDLPGEKSVAFSTGGCLWGDNGKKRFLTEIEANTLELIYGNETRRDTESNCLVFDYNDAGVSYQVWYADTETLNYWITIAKQQGINNISLWRLGGNMGMYKIK